ncbi:hypothetical protein [Lentzea sp. NPDC060358]|uniref:hypothetical protein n=1 Tax=Lentzea sp. NPDC060358 TaxID=3347103 RepID=UPI0036678765
MTSSEQQNSREDGRLAVLGNSTMLAVGLLADVIAIVSATQASWREVAIFFGAAGVLIPIGYLSFSRRAALGKRLSAAAVALVGVLAVVIGFTLPKAPASNSSNPPVGPNSHSQTVTITTTATTTTPFVGPDPALHRDNTGTNYKTIVAGSAVDLDSLAPDGGFEDVAEEDVDTDFTFVSNLTASRKIAPSAKRVTYADCANSKGEKEVADADVKRGLVLCILTTEHRWASVTVSNRYVENGATELDLQIVVWKRPDES